MLGRDGSLLETPWPSYQEEALEAQTMLVVLQVNGKVRSRIVLPADCDEKQIEAEALADERIQRFIDGKPIKKVIVVKKRNLVNVVI